MVSCPTCRDQLTTRRAEKEPVEAKTEPVEQAETKPGAEQKEA